MKSETSATSHERRAFVADPGVLHDLGLDLGELADPDVRSHVIRMEHPELDEAIREGREEIELNGQPVSPRLHLLMHEVVVNQLWDDEPSEAWETAKRLLARGYEIMHMLASTMAAPLWSAANEQQAYDRARHVAALRALPGSWERERARLRPVARERHRRR